MEKRIVGYGGKGGGAAAGGPREAPNTLKSEAYAKIIDVLSEGEIEGLVDGAKSIYLDEIPVQNSDGSFNFDGFSYAINHGTQNQSYLPSFADARSTKSVGTKVAYDKPVTISIEDSSIDAIVVTVRVPQLTYQNPETGSIKGYFIHYHIEIKGASDSVYDLATGTQIIEGKTVSPYDRAHRVELGTDFPYNIRVVKDTIDETKTNVSADLYFATYTEIIDAKLSYPNTAHLGLQVNAEHFQRIPTRAYKVKLLRIRVPTNYDPITREYDGVWDGSFKIAWSNNPAWCFFDLVTNTRYGLGSLIPEATVDKWNLYTIGKYCDELVPDGFGGTEPRFTCNLYIQTREEAYKVVRDLSSIFRGIVYWGGETLLTIQDAPTSATSIFTNSNIIDGEFVYSGSSNKTRHTVALITWNDPEDFYRQKIEYVEDTEAISQRGIIETELVAVGATSRGQAHRLGRWVLYTERFEKDTVSFRTSIEAAGVRPGQVIQIKDNFKAGRRIGGRILQVESGRLVLDNLDISEFTGTNYNITFQTQLAEDVANPVSGTQDKAKYAKSYTVAIDSFDVISINNETKVRAILSLGIPNDYLPAVGANFLITQDNIIEPTLYRVMGLTEEEFGVFGITAVMHDPNKYSEVESTLSFEDKPLKTAYSNIPGIPSPVENIKLSSYAISKLNSLDLVTIVSWENNIDAKEYIVTLKFDQGDWLSFPRTSNNYLEIINLEPGYYTARVQVVGYNNLLSNVAESAVTYINFENNLTMPDITGLELFNSSNGEEFSGRDAKFIWRESSTSTSYEIEEDNDFGADSGIRDYFFKDYEIRILVNGELIRTEHTFDPFYVYTYEKNVEDGGPYRDFTIEVYQRGTSNQFSANAARLTVSNPQASPLLGLSITPTFKNILVDFTPPTETDWAGLLIWVSTTSGFIPTGTVVGDGNCVYDGNSPPIAIPVSPGDDGNGNYLNTTFYVRVAPYDTFGKVGYQDSLSSEFVANIIPLDEVDFADLSIGTAKIQDLAVDSAKIANASIVEAKIADAAITTAKIEDAAITAAKIGDAEITNAKIQDAAITNAKISGAIQSDNFILTPGVEAAGFKLDKNDGSLIAQQLSVYDANGNIIMAAGSGPEWQAIVGANKPEDNATNGADWDFNIINLPTTISDINQQEGLIVDTVASEFAESFDSSNVISNWQNYTGTPEIDVVSIVDSSFGGKVLRIGNNLGNDQAWLLHKRLIPYDPTRSYRAKVTLRQVAGLGTVFIGWAGVAANGTTLVNIDGDNLHTSQHYHVANNVVVPSIFTEYIGYTEGFGATVGTLGEGTITTPGQMHPDVRYIRPLVVVNYNSKPGRVEIDSFIMESKVSAGSTTATWGDITDAPVSFGSNLLYNSGLRFSSFDGWNHDSNIESIYEINSIEGALSNANAPYGTLRIHQSGTSTTASNWFSDPNFKIPVIEGTRYEASVYSGSFQSIVTLLIDWYDINGTLISSSGGISSSTAVNNEQALGGSSLATYKRIYVLDNAPIGAVSAGLTFRKHGTKAGFGESNALFTLPYFGAAGDTQTVLSTWSEGAGSNVANTITDQGAFATLNQITSSNSGVYIGNAAIGNVQIADAAITTAKIGDLQVDTLKIANNAVTIPEAVFQPLAVTAAEYNANSVIIDGRGLYEVCDITIPAQSVGYKAAIQYGFSHVLTISSGVVFGYAVLYINGSLFAINLFYRWSGIQAQWGGSNTASTTYLVAPSESLNVKLYLFYENAGAVINQNSSFSYDHSLFVLGAKR